MLKEHPNISILKKINPANPSSAADILAEDFVWHYYNPELPNLEGDYFGLTGLEDFFASLAGRTDGSFKVNPISITPLGDQIVITHVKDMMVMDGKEMEIDAIVIWCLIDRMVKEAWDIPILRTAKLIETIKEQL